jgi:RNA polymerase sigma-70 factor (ECF subfamily)
LDRAREARDSESWERLVALYTPLIRRWLSTYDIKNADADDLIQEVFTVVLSELPSFHHNQRTGAFRNWLRKVLVHRLRHFWRKQKYAPQARGTSTLMDRLNELEDDKSQYSRIWNAEHDQHVIAHIIKAVRPRFHDKTWQAFSLQVLEGKRADVAAAQLNMPINSVYVARSRVLSSLRREAAGLVDLL